MARTKKSNSNAAPRGTRASSTAQAAGVPQAPVAAPPAMPTVGMPSTAPAAPQGPQVAVRCCGLTGVFLLDTSQVVCDGVIMAPTAFERRAGMGHAKKWRRSILVAGPEGIPLGR